MRARDSGDEGVASGGLLAGGPGGDCPVMLGALGLALGLSGAVLDPRLRGVLPRIRAADVIAIGPRDRDELAAAGVPARAG